MAITFEAEYIGDIFVAVLGYDRAKATRGFAVGLGLAKFLRFDVTPKKVAGPTP